MNNTPEHFSKIIENVIRESPAEWLVSACEILRKLPPSVSAEFALQSLPTTSNANLSFQMNAALIAASNQMSWEALSWALQTTYMNYQQWQIENRIELLWTGPSPAGQIPARRIDQALYDLISNAKTEITLVTFAAAKIERLTGALWNAAQRGIRIKLILEFESSSEGQLSFDAMRAFPASLIKVAEIYHWPIEKRERNQAGRPGKLHAKVAIVDDSALVSSANLTDDAFNRNLEMGVMLKNPYFLLSVKSYIDSLITGGVLSQVSDCDIS